jgi:AraC-like DNA-binding protein
MASLLAKVVGVDVDVQCSLEAAGGFGLVRRRTKTCRGRCSHAMALPAAAPRGHSPALMLDDLRRFSTDAFPEALRQSALDEVLGRALVRSEAANVQGMPPLQGHVSSRSSTLDSVFVRLASSPQVLVPDGGTARHSGRAVLLFVLLKGSAVLEEQGACVTLGANAAVLLDPAQPWRLALHTDCRALLLKLESASFLLRLVRTCSPEAKRITPAHGVGAMCLTMAESLAEQIDHLGRDDLLSVEATLTDLLVTCLSREVESSGGPDGLAEPSDQPTSVQLSHLRRICRTVEARLGDAELSLESVARVEGLSTRYLQKLFKVGASSFGEYLRERRLERCKPRLGQPRAEPLHDLGAVLSLGLRRRGQLQPGLHGALWRVAEGVPRAAGVAAGRCAARPARAAVEGQRGQSSRPPRKTRPRRARRTAPSRRCCATTPATPSRWR